MLVSVVASLATTGASSAAAQYAQWGKETIERIHRDLYLANSRLYAESSEPSGHRSGPAFAWSASVMLSALCAAARTDHKYKIWLRDYANSLPKYWRNDGPVAGFDVLPGTQPIDRYYDDNAWLALAFADAYETIGDPKYLKLAEGALAFCLSGEDPRLGGGVCWRERDRSTKNCCSNAPVAYAAFRLAKIADKPAYETAAARIYDWTVSKLRDPFTGLYYDSIDSMGKIDKTLWSYNSAMMIQAGKSRGGDINVLRDVALKQWTTPDGAFASDAAFAVLLFEACYPERPKTLAAIDFLHEKCKDPIGHYGKRWDMPAKGRWSEYKLIDQASAALAFFWAAQHG